MYEDKYILTQEMIDSIKPELPYVKTTIIIDPIHKHLPLDPQEFQKNFEPNYNKILDYRFENSLESGQNAVAYEEGHVPDFLCNITSDQLKRLAPSVLQIRAEPRATMLRLSPSYGVMSMAATLMLLMWENWPFQYATSSALGSEADKDSKKRIKFGYDFFYNYEHIKDNDQYKERDIYRLALDCDNKHNDLAFVIFKDIATIPKQTFFVPTSKTWDLHGSDVFIFAYASQYDNNETKQRVFPYQRKLLKPGTVKFWQPNDGPFDSHPDHPPIIGVHTCSAVEGMEGGAIASVNDPCELIGIHVAGVWHLEFEHEKGVDNNFFVSVHHPRFVQYYLENVIPELCHHSKQFLKANWDKIDAYLQVHSYKLNDIIPRRYSTRQKSTNSSPNCTKRYTKQRVVLKPFN